ncbi:MAG: N-methyl-L-tryptophan oxidase [Actinobacteria bacterium]|nr:N-methyl-L-tryptophan oxidase [Actinomycetota bacterium]
MKRVDHVVVGGGIMGSATTRALSKLGKKVVLLEQFRLGHKRGSSHGRTRIFRFSYPDAMYVAMAQESLELWRDLEREAGTELVHTTGGLDIGPRVAENARALEERGAGYEWIDGSTVRDRFPPLSLPADAEVLFQPDSGVIYADAAIASFVTSAMDAGADVIEERQVISIEPHARSVIVRTPGGDFEGDSIVVTAGPWAKKLLATIEIDLPVRPTRETVAYFDCDTSSVPTFVEWGSPSVYSLPSPGQGLKVGEHIAGPVADPDSDQPVDAQSVQRMSEWVTERFTGVDAEPRFSETCFYTNTKDEHFILERHGDIVVGSPCSGHGFKFAPLIGRRLAEFAVD